MSLSPAYDLINTTIALATPQEEIALPLMGRKRNLTRKILVDYWGKERLGLNERTIGNVVNELEHAIPAWRELIGKSFLSRKMRDKYFEILAERTKIIW